MGLGKLQKGRKQSMLEKHKIFIVINGRPMSKDNEKLFNSRGRPFTSKKYKDYAFDVSRQAAWQMAQNGWLVLCQPVQVEFKFYFRNNVRLDLLNAPKSICDAFNRVVWMDDRLIHKSCLELCFDQKERVEVQVSVI